MVELSLASLPKFEKVSLVKAAGNFVCLFVCLFLQHCNMTKILGLWKQTFIRS